MGDPLDFAVITALVLAATQALSPSIRALLSPHARRVQSFGGGIGLAYVFVSLFPEIDNVHPWLGQNVYLVTLVSFLLFFALEAWLVSGPRSRRRGMSDIDSGLAEPAVFWLHIAVIIFYTAIVMFALPDSVANDFLFATATGLAIGVHLIYKDYLLRAHADSQFQVSGRFLLTMAPLLGWVAHRIVDPSEAVLDLAMAALAGVLMQSVFRDELPRPDRASLPWMVAGVAIFVTLSLLA